MLHPFFFTYIGLKSRKNFAIKRSNLAFRKRKVETSDSSEDEEPKPKKPNALKILKAVKTNNGFPLESK